MSEYQDRTRNYELYQLICCENVRREDSLECTYQFVRGLLIMSNDELYLRDVG